MTTKTETHNKAVITASQNLIENGISTVSGSTKGIDLVTTDGKNILVRGISGEVAIPLMNGSLDTLKADYVIIVTRLETTYNRGMYIMTMDEAKRLAVNNPYKVDGRNNYFIRPGDYRYYQNDHSSFR